MLTLAGDVALERASDAIAADIGMGSAIFGATVLAAATAIPEIATGLQAVRLGDHQMAISDIFGGNAFLPAPGLIVTCLYLVGLVYRDHRLVARMGYDSLLVVLVYIAGLAGRVLFSGGG